MPYQIRDGLSFCLVGGRPIFLDLHANRYFTLGPRHEEAFEELICGTPLPDLRAVDELRQIGLLQTDSLASAIRPTTWSQPAEASYLDEPGLTSATGIRIRLCARMVQTAFLLKTRPLGRIVAELRALKRRRAERGYRSDIDVRGHAHALEWTRRYTTAHDRCLLRSLTLDWQLASAGAASALVFGVTTRPFRAHCWVEHEGMILNDRRDVVRNYTPILVVT